MNSSFRTCAILGVLLCSGLAGCGGSSGSSASNEAWAFGGTVDGLQGTVVLSNFGTLLSLDANGAFEFAGGLPGGTAYSVTVFRQPADRWCTVENGSGTITSRVSDIRVHCVALLKVVVTTPANLAIEVARDAAPLVIFSAPVDATTLNAGNVSLSAGGRAVETHLSVSGPQLTVRPERPMTSLTTYSLVIGRGIRGLGGEVVNEEVGPSFRTRDLAWRGAGTIDSPVVNIGDFPVVACDGKGNALAVWRVSSGGSSNVWSNYYTTGRGWGEASGFSTNYIPVGGSPEVAMNANGNAIAVWVGQASGRSDIHSSYYTAGTGWGADLLGETDDAANAGSPRVAIDAAGNAIAVWRRGGLADSSIWANRFVPGAGWGVAAELQSPGTMAHSPDVAIDAAGNVHVIWIDGDGTRPDVWSARAASGSGWDTPELIWSNETGGYVDAQIAVNSAGHALAVWRHSDGTIDRILAARRAPGAPWMAPEILATETTGTASGLRVVLDSAGNAMAVWEQGDASRRRIWANRYVAAAGWGTPMIIDSGRAGSAFMPRIGVDANGNSVVAWTESAGGRLGAWSNRYRLDAGWHIAEPIDSESGPNAEALSLAVEPDGGAFAAWYELGAGGSKIWSNRLD